jgi:hypothetical protein
MKQLNSMKTINHTPALRRLGSLALSALAILLLASRASADIFFFSTGNPDGKIATLSVPATAGSIQTETADDFAVTATTLINAATFTGLIPPGADARNIQQVEIEMYHVFPGDSDTNRIITVPTRANSPGDVEIGAATRDSANGSLSFNATVVNSSFTASNSVIVGILPATNQFTGGEGPVTGQEVTVTVTFNPPISLTAGHYFFRPEVLLPGAGFLWLSAPRPIVTPGTPFPAGVTDLQSWIRNDNLAPDWLRIGTDITHQGPFNACFSLLGETDQDGDGIPDSQDQCPNTPPGSIVNADGCSIDQLVPCDGPWKNHGEFVSTMAHVTKDFEQAGLITQSQRNAILSAAAQSDCGKK